MSQKVWGEQISGREKVKRPHLSTFPTTMTAFSSSRRSKRGQGIESKTKSKQTYFLRKSFSNIFPPSYTSKSVWGEREKASMLHISYHHVCFHHPSSNNVQVRNREQGIESKPKIKQTFFWRISLPKHFFLQAMPQKVCGEKGKRPRCSTFPTTMSAFSSSSEQLCYIASRTSI